MHAAYLLAGAHIVYAFLQTCLQDIHTLKMLVFAVLSCL
jgi:hypothetical protein